METDEDQMKSLRGLWFAACLLAGSLLFGTASWGATAAFSQDSDGNNDSTIYIYGGFPYIYSASQGALTFAWPAAYTTDVEDPHVTCNNLSYFGVYCDMVYSFTVQGKSFPMGIWGDLDATGNINLSLPPTSTVVTWYLTRTYIGYSFVRCRFDTHFITGAPTGWLKTIDF